MMDLFTGFQQSDTTCAAQAFQAAEDTILPDVRLPREYRAGHIPGSKNLSLQQLDKVDALTDNINTNIHNIGGIAAYKGKVE